MGNINYLSLRYCIDMIYGLDEFYSGLIEEAKSPEEIKKILDYQFVQGKGVPREVLDSVFDIDPTKKKSYTRWVLMQYDRYGEEILKAIRSGKLERMFKTFKERASDSENGGLDLTNMESFEKAMEYVPDIDPCLTKEGDPNSPENDFDVIYDTDEWTIAVPHTYEANRKLGRGCRWCTAGAFGDNDYYWNRYSPAGPIFVNYDRRHSEVAPKDHKEYPYTRYQFLFEWQNWAGELMDSNDERVDFETVDMPEDVIEFYGEQNPKYKDMIENGSGDPQERWEDYNDDRVDMAITVLDGDSEDLCLLPEQNDEMNLNTDYMLYSSDDFSDSYDTYYFSGPDSLVARGIDGKSALLKDIRDRYIYAWIDEDDYISVGKEDNHWVDPSGEVIFILGDNKLCIMPRNGHIDATTVIVDLYKYFGDSYIGNVEINPQISQIAMDNGIEGYHGLVCEISFEDLYHGLFMYDGYDAVTMIKKDIPQADMFEAVADNGNICIKGASFDYKFGKGGKADASNLQISKEIYTANGEKYYIVTYGEDEEYCNIYDVAQRKLIFETPCSQYAEMTDIDGSVSLLLCDFINSSKALYSINKRDFLIPPCSNIRQFYGSGENEQCWMSRKTNSSPFTLYYYDKSGFRKIMDVAEANTILRSDDGGIYTIITLINGGITVLNLKNGEFPIKEADFVAQGSMRGVNFCFLQKPEQKQAKVCNIYNFVTGEKMVDNYNYGLGRPARLVYGMDIWEIKCDGGENLINRNGKLLLPRNVDAILDASATEPILIPLRDNNHMWFLNPQNMELLPTKEGIDLSVFPLNGGKNYYEMPFFEYKGTPFSFFTEGGILKIGVASDDPNIKNEIESIIFRQQASIRESFNRVLNMINNFYKDKD